jgi:hypothetical protein
MATSDGRAGASPSRRRWKQGAAGTPFLLAAVLLSFRWSEQDWLTAGEELVTSAYTLVAIVVFVDFVLFHPGRPPDVRRGRSVGAALYWAAAGMAALIGSLAVRLLPYPWLEASVDVVGVTLAAACLGDAWRRLTDT